MALVAAGVRIPLKIGEAQAGPIGERPHLLLLVECGPEGQVQHLAALDCLHQLGGLAAHHQADGVAAVFLGMAGKLAEDAVRLAATAGTAIADLVHRTGEERRLWAGLGLPDGLKGVVYCFVPSIVFGPYCFSHVSASCASVGALNTNVFVSSVFTSTDCSVGRT